MRSSFEKHVACVAQVCALAIGVCAVMPRLSAQEVRCQIFGRITDPTGSTVVVVIVNSVAPPPRRSVPGKRAFRICSGVAPVA